MIVVDSIRSLPHCHRHRRVFHLDLERILESQQCISCLEIHNLYFPFGFWFWSCQQSSFSSVFFRMAPFRFAVYVTSSLRTVDTDPDVNHCTSMPVSQSKSFDWQQMLDTGHKQSYYQPCFRTYSILIRPACLLS
jgi:hypothetical protein